MRSLRWFLAGLVAGAILAGFGAGWFRVVTAQQGRPYTKYLERVNGYDRCIFVLTTTAGVDLEIINGAC